MNKKSEFPEIISVKPLQGYRLYLEYSDGVKGVADLSHLKGKGVFALWNKEENFSKVGVDINGCLVWNDEVDIDSLNCYLKIINKTFEEYANS